MLEEILSKRKAKELREKIGPTNLSTVGRSLREFADACTGLGADLCRMAASELKTKLDSGELTLAVLHEEVRHLRKYFERHLASAKLFALSPDDAKFYDVAVVMLGDDVVLAFGSAMADIEEAGKCLALGRVAAAIFHLMRVVEVGLRSLAPQLGITERNPSWNTVTSKLDREIELAPRERTLTADYAFLEDISAQMHAVNRAWRTRAMHVDATFSQENARDIFNATKALMQHLAIQLSE